MKISLPDIPDEGLELDYKETIPIEEALLDGPVDVRLSVRKVGRELVLSGRFTAAVRLQCGRCLKEFTKDLDLPVDVVYDAVEDMEGRRELKRDEMDTGFYRGEELDVDELVREQLLLDIQMKPLCNENCKGLCPHCGTDLNTGGCTCASGTTDVRLEALKKFFEKGKE
jgi:uncharacterized protein